MCRGMHSRVDAAIANEKRYVVVERVMGKEMSVCPREPRAERQSS